MSSLYARLVRTAQATLGVISAETWDLVRRVLVGFDEPSRRPLSTKTTANSAEADRQRFEARA